MTVLRISGALAFLVVAVAAAWSAVFVTAGVSHRPVVFLSAGLAAYAAVGVLAGWLLTRGLSGVAAARSRAVGAVVAVALVLVPAAWAVAAPARPAAAPPLTGVRYWVLSDGSRLAVLLLPAHQPKAAADPVVFLHGGPGVADMDHDAAVLGRLARTGRDIWLYDQLGAGRSSRLSDPTGYSLERDVSDLEEVRRRIGADRIVLIGHSYGATLAATYLSRHPEHVSGIVFSSPGRLVPEVGDVSGTGMLGRLTPRQQLTAFSSLLAPRALLTWSLVKADPRAAHALSGDDEMDARFATLYRQSAPGIVCDGSKPPPTPARLGFYANQVPVSDTRVAPDIRPALRSVRVPALVLKGACDYLPWSFATDYRDSVPGSQLIYFNRSGHQLYQEQQDDYLALLTAFLAGAPLPMSAWPAPEPPADYRGTY